MRFLPYYLEDNGVKFDGSISLLDNLNILSEKDAILILCYMSDCIVIDEWLSNIKNPINNKFEIPSKTWSDGVYVWDSIHIFYVKKYRARLPLNFVKHVKDQIKNKFDSGSLKHKEVVSEFEKNVNSIAKGDYSFFDVFI